MASRRRAYLDNYQLYSIDGSPAMDFIGRYEQLEQDISKALTMIGLANALILPKTNMTKIREQDYRSYYSAGTKATVAEWYAREIALLGYTF